MFLIDTKISINGLDPPTKSEARIVDTDRPRVAATTSEIDLEREDITSINWTKGYATDYSWSQVDPFDDQAKPLHH